MEGGFPTGNTTLNQDTTGTTAGTPPASSSLYTLKVKLSGLPRSVTLRVDVVDANGTRKIYEQVHKPDETVEITTRGTGEEVKFQIYYDNQLVKEVVQGADQRGSGGNNG